MSFRNVTVTLRCGGGCALNLRCVLVLPRRRLEMLCLSVNNDILSTVNYFGSADLMINYNLVVEDWLLNTKPNDCEVKNVPPKVIEKYFFPLHIFKVFSFIALSNLRDRSSS